MSPFENDLKPNGKRTELVWTISQLVFAASSLVLMVLTIADRITLEGPYGFLLLGIALSTLYIAGIVLFVRRLRRVRTYGLRLALTGLPAVGKTMFSVLVFDTLMNERLPNLRFSAESRSIISVYQAIRNLSSEVWPRSTAKGSISVYEGVMESRRLRVNLELGDSAGEYWLDFGEEDQRDPGYLEYVISANGLVHVIPIESVLTSYLSPNYLNDEIQDLRLVARLKRQTRGDAAQVPLLIVLSKVDLVVPPSLLEQPHSGLLQIVDITEVRSLSLMSGFNERDEARLLDALHLLSESLDADFSSVQFVFSSVPAIVQSRLGVGETGSGLIRWILRTAINTPKGRPSIFSILSGPR
ncbi:hypothetical protein GCM10009682_38270 [Luedemannella flava]|uniref:Uncharacterized protein n=1 Tax=Luedemannella flava TaxID=349316 RepID=A0ABP4YJX1_9ACTN